VRAVRFLRDNGIRQFLDVGTGLPTSPNTYEVAQAGHPDARVVYVDNDPVVLRRRPCVRSEPGSLLVAAGRGSQEWEPRNLPPPGSALVTQDARLRSRARAPAA
jgi:hypothetical protein